MMFLFPEEFKLSQLLNNNIEDDWYYETLVTRPRVMQTFRKSERLKKRIKRGKTLAGFQP